MQLTKINKWALSAYWLISMLYWEILTHAGLYGQFQASFRYALGFTAALGLAVAVLVGLLPRKAARPVNLVLTIGMILIYGSQLVYNFIFGTPYSVSQMGMGGDAITSFWRETLGAMADHWPWLLALMVPMVLLVLVRKAEKPGLIIPTVSAVLAVVLLLLTWADICRGGTAMYSDYYFFTSVKSTTTQIMERFGLPTTFCLELTNTEDPDAEDQEILIVPEAPTAPVREETEKVIEYDYNNLDVDFEALSASTTNKRHISLNNFCSALPGTKQNKYTGMLKDYNLILICAESYSPAAVDPVYTPTLYKLTHEGFLFRNYYNSFPNTTTDGEYTLTLGLFPDSIHGKEYSSMLVSADRVMPFALGNLFETQRGIKSWGYHNNVGSYYRRNISHPNLGYEMQFNHSGMEISGSWPTSDLEMMEQSVDDYIHQPQFHAYYMTFSGHYPYKVPDNTVAAKNYEEVDGLSQYDMGQKAYLSCHIELDRALEYLMRRLEEEGVADKTAIVLAADHIPYGLTEEEYFDMIGHPQDFFDLYKSDLIFWVGGMEEPIEVDEYCCNVDVLPTILNLWGFHYDSRMLAGTDILSDGMHAAMLIDHSFLTDQAWFNTNTGEIRYQVDPSQLPENYIENMNQYVESRFDFSTRVLRNDYYKFVFGRNPSFA